MVIQEAVAVEALKLSKWIIAIVVAILSVAALLPEILPRVTKASVLGTIEIELVELKLSEAQKRIGLKFEGAPKDIKTILESSRDQLDGQKFLWIDNEPANNTSIRNLFEKAGVAFEVTVSGKRAEDLISTNRYDLVISDIGRGQHTPSGIEDYNRWKTKYQLPPWFFYSASQGDPVSGVVLSTNNPYLLIKKIVNTVKRNNPVTCKSRNNESYNVPIWFYLAGFFILALTCLFISWIIHNSKSLHPHNKSMQPTADASAD